MGFGSGELDEALEACALGVHLRGGVVRRCSAKPLLRGGLRQRSMQVADVDEAAGKGRSRRHDRRDEVGAAEPALTALEIAVRGRGAALARAKLIGVHAEAHGAAWLAPIEAGFLEDRV